MILQPLELSAYRKQPTTNTASETDDVPSLPVRDPFPTHVLPEPLRSLVEHAALQTTVPESLCATVGLGIASAAMGSAFRVRSGHGLEVGGNLYLLVFAESGTGKGRAFNVMAAPWFAAGKALMEKWTMEERPSILADLETANADLERGKKERRANASATDAASAEETIRDAMQRRTTAEQALILEPLLNIGNATAEAIAEALAHSPGEAGAVISAEGRDIVANLMGRYSKDGKGSDEAIFLQAYSGDPVTHKRKCKVAIILHAPCLTLCVAVQPDIWDRMASDPRLIESGFLARAMAFNSHARPMRPSDHSIPSETADAWRSIVLDLLSFRGNPSPPVIVTPSPEAKQMLDALAHEAADKREEKINGREGEWYWCHSFAARLAENAWRLALVFHAIQYPKERDSPPLSLETAAAAETVVRWFFAETLTLLSPIRSQKNSARMEKLTRILQDNPAHKLPMWKLLQNHGFKELELRTIATEFPHRLQIVEGTPGPQGGRMSTYAQLLQPYAHHHPS